MRLPRVANLDEFQPLAAEPGVRVRYVGDARELGAPDLIIIPGTKSTLGDLAWLRARGLADAVAARRAAGTPVLGICGGYQMLGSRIIDEHGAESAGTANGLGLLPLTTRFEAEKLTRRVAGRAHCPSALWPTPPSEELEAYEIHMGRTTVDDGAALGGAPFVIVSPQQDQIDGASSVDGMVVGTYMHGLLENVALRRALITSLAARKGVTLPDAGALLSVDQSLDALAETVAAYVDIAAIGEMIGAPIPAIR